MSTHVVTSRHPWLIGKTDETLICKVCGTRVYGSEKVDALREVRQLEAKRAAEAEEKRIEAQKRAEIVWKMEAAKKSAEQKAEDSRRRAAEHRAREKAKREEARRLEEEARQAILAQAKCAWPPCKNDHTSTSKYCSRSCNNNSARARHKERKAALKASASQA